MGKMQKYLAEALGTFALVGVGSFAIVSAPRPATGSGSCRSRSASASRCSSASTRSARCRAGHFNPAVSLAMFLDRRISMDDLIGYVGRSSPARSPRRSSS